MTRRRVSISLVAAALVVFAGQPAFSQTAADLQAPTLPPNAVWLDTLDLSLADQEWASPRARRSVDNAPLTLGKVVYPHGVGAHANFQMLIQLNGCATKFVAMAGVDDEKAGYGSVTFSVDVDGKTVAATPTLHGGDAPQLVSVDLTGAKALRLRIGDGDDGIDSDHGDWAGAMILLAPGATDRPKALPTVVVPYDLPRYTVPTADPKPAIHGPKTVGATPGRPFLFLVPATGNAPLSYSAVKLPAGVALDPATGIISGSVAKPGTTVATVTVKNALGSTSRTLTFVAGGHKLAQTPPMGWNSWNCWAGNVSDAHVRDAADAMIASGLAAHGYQYVNIDDCWEAGRTDSGEILSNAKFPNMPALTDYVHRKGLRAGIYSSPGPKTCAGFTACYQHEAQDAATYAKWGFDYLKYDWCSYGGIVANDNSLEAKQKPYKVMRDALDLANRDIVYSFCQYGMGNVASWGEAFGGNCWRTTGDINDSWKSLHGIYEHQNGLEKYAGPGHWNDPDMLVVGEVGWGHTHPSHLLPNEQILHMTLWSLFAAPLLIGCDMTKLDDFTKAILMNDEVIDIDQDPLGHAAGKLPGNGTIEVWSRPLADGTVAVGLTNPTPSAQTGTVNWADIGVKGAQPVRDLWLHKDLGAISGSYSVEVPAHGAVLIKIGKGS